MSVTTPLETASPRPRRLGRSAAAVFLGFVVVVVLSLATDQLLHVLGVYPPLGQPMHEASLNLLALVYRCAYGVAGAYVTAWWAPHSPVRHALALTALPCAWLGGALHRAKPEPR